MQKQDDSKEQKQIKENYISSTNKDQTFSKQTKLDISTGSNNNTSNISGDEEKKDILLVVDERYSTEIKQYLTTNYSLENLADLIKQIDDYSNILNQHHGMIGIRKILSLTGKPLIQAVIDSGLVPKMINYIKQQEYPQLQLQAAWAIANVASGTTQQCEPIIDNGGISIFVDLLQSNKMCITEPAIRAIINISISCAQFRDSIINAGGLVNLVQLNDKLIDKTLIMLCCRAISNLCLGLPLPKYDTVKLALPILCLAIATGELTDKQILSDCLWAIFYHSKLKNKILIVVENGVIPQIIKNMKGNEIDLVLPCIRILRNISSAGTIEYVNQLLENGGLQSLENLLDHQNRMVRREVCWVVSKITAGNKLQVQAVLARGQMLKTLLRMLETDKFDVRRQICYIFSNMVQLGDPQQIFSLYKTTNIVRNYVNILSSNNRRYVQTALECLSVILGHGQQFRDNGNNTFVMDLFSINAVDSLEKLQYHKSEKIYQYANKIISTYFQTEQL